MRRVALLALYTHSFITQMFMKHLAMPSVNGGHMSLTPAVVFHVEGFEPAPTPGAAAPLPCGLSLEGEARPAALPFLFPVS